MSEHNIRVHDIVQLSPHEFSAFAGCLVIVTEVRRWGVIGYVQIPGKKSPGQAYMRVRIEDCVRVGRAEWTDLEPDEEPTLHLVK
jgi:hypothetical protein